MNTSSPFYTYYTKFILKQTHLMLIIFLILGAFVNAQVKGNISGKVIDKNTNEVLIGANILVVGTNFGSSTDIDGNYSIKNLDAGIYSLKISYISYRSTVIEKVIVNIK